MGEMIHNLSRWAIVSSAAVLVACGANAGGRNIRPLVQETLPVPLPTLDLNQVNAGRKIYQTYCASCHGANAEGAPNWKTPDAQFDYPSPPQNDDGHTWHHSDKLLFEITRDGFADPLKPGAPKRMPPFGDKLSDEEIHAVIEYFKSLWSREHREFQWRVTNSNFSPARTLVPP